MLSLDLVDLYAQLGREAAIYVKPPPLLELPKQSTRSELSKAIALGLADDQTPIRLVTNEERASSSRRKKELSAEARRLSSQRRGGSGDPDFWKENTKPIQVDPAVPMPYVPNRPSAQSRQRLKQLAKELKESGTLDLDPYVSPLIAATFEAYLPMVVAEATIEALDIDTPGDPAAYRIPNLRCIWDTGAHHTVVSEDLLPISFVNRIRDAEYMAIYGSEGNTAVQISINIQFSNCLEVFETICVVRPSETLPNGFSGVILGEHGLLNLMDYHVVPRKVLQYKGVDIQGEWSQIRLLRHVVDDQYNGL